MIAHGFAATTYTLREELVGKGHFRHRTYSVITRGSDDLVTLTIYPVTADQDQVTADQDQIEL